MSVVAFLLVSSAVVVVAVLANDQECANRTSTTDQWGPCEADGELTHELTACYQQKVTWSDERAAHDCGFQYSLVYRRCDCSLANSSSTVRLSYINNLAFYNYNRRIVNSSGFCKCPVTVANSSKINSVGDQCGMRTSGVTFRILGGSTVRRHSWKWVASLVHDKLRGYVHCGATLIAPKWILTAAHCLHDGSGRPRMLKVVLGDHSRQLIESTEVVRSIVRAFMPPGYELFSTHKDIALLKLDRPVHRSAYTDYACLPPRTASAASGTSCYITGWGKTSMDGQSSPEELQEAEIPLVSWSACKNVPAYSFITRRQLCAGIRGDNPRDACAGDSGGGLFCVLPSESSKEATSAWQDSKAKEDQSLTRVRVRRSLKSVSSPKTTTGRTVRSWSTLRATTPRRAVLTQSQSQSQSQGKNANTKVTFTYRTTRKLNLTTKVSYTTAKRSTPRPLTWLLTRTRRIVTLARTTTAQSNSTVRRTTKSSAPTSRKITHTQTRRTTQTTKPTPTSKTAGSRWYAYGVTSFGAGCGLHWGVYQRVSAFSDWIKTTVATYDS